jgi:hypothetical protein
VGNCLAAVADDRASVFSFLAGLQQDPQLRAALNEVCTADEVAAIAAERGFSFSPATLVDLFKRCNEAPVARSGLMDEKLIRVFLQREALLND